MNDRPVILKDMSKINEIKVTYFVMTEEEYLEEDSDCEFTNEKKSIVGAQYLEILIYIFI